MTLDDYKRYCAAVKDRFRGSCPYTDVKCDSFDCENCDVEKEERKWIKESEK